MNRLLTGSLLLLLWAGHPQATRADSMRTSITEDGTFMTITLDGYVDDKPVHFSHTADVAGKHALQKELIVYRAFKRVGSTPPLHMMSGLITTGLGLFGAIVTAALFLWKKKMRLA
ncbi:hypothetical protein [Arsenicibacter rosenii]|uniref:Uncharacterized protein n=1 Tax=Arsenicibacter rosenii TaxID=1750698 RepID=A0A1S2VIB1_9BACT|nr:hypothetical protein [Arsenicibacter rosenii]OIN58497.1 hypothetical protein BLX24_13045 [Arsenicibacter rosenii]